MIWRDARGQCGEASADLPRSGLKTIAGGKPNATTGMLALKQIDPEGGKLEALEAYPTRAILLFGSAIL